MSASATDDIRSQTRLTWAQTVLHSPNLALESASSDAGFRSYWRTLGHASSHIVMDAPPGKEDVRPWLRVHDLLAQHGVRVPQVLARDAEHGFLLLEDLGGPNAAQIVTDATSDSLMSAALQQLVHLQALPLPADFPAFGEALLQRDAGLFEEWFIRHHLGLELSCADAERLELVQRRLMDNALTQAQVPTHRDFMLRNLMPCQGTLAVLDFQDMVRGPIAYDPASLMRDAFLSWPEPRVSTWLQQYHALALQAGLPVPNLPTFLRDVDWLGVQRHLKILGIFARLHHRDAKPRYLADAPRFFAYLDAVVPKYPELAPLAELLDATLKPAFAKVSA